MNQVPSLFDLESLSSAYAAGLTPESTISEVYARVRAAGDNPIWISLVPEAEALARARALAASPDARKLPLYGVPFAVKDNIDVAGLPTTAACPAFSYQPERNATVVERLIAAGAICIGKTNLDQFATGLVGTRSPYGAVRNAINPAYISGGSSSGSAVAVALGLVSFSLGTDTAGSGRVPAGFNNIVGLKPSRGRISTHGVVPACRTLDCVSVFALSCTDALTVLRAAEGTDNAAPYSRAMVDAAGPAHPVVGVPREADLQWFGDALNPSLYTQALEHLERLGARIVSVDFSPFAEAARLLYDGPWVAERHVALRDFIERNPEAMLPVTRSIIGAALRYSASDAFQAQYRLADLAALTSHVWNGVNALCVPTAPTIYTREQLEREPVAFNSHLGQYTNFVNLLDLSALAVPAGWRADGLPFGVTFIGRTGDEAWLCALGERLRASVAPTAGATGVSLPYRAPATPQASQESRGNRQIAVMGAHLSGQPLNRELTTRDARLVRTTRTAPHYRLYALPNTQPPKPGLVRTANAQGASIEVEIWELTSAAFGDFIATIPAPLGIATLELEDASRVQGFICESYAIESARDISTFGGWRAYLDSLQSHPLPKGECHEAS